MDYNRRLEILKSSIGSNVSSELKTISFELEDSLLLNNTIPVDAANFVIQILSLAPLTSSDGIAHIFAALLSDWHKYDNEQRSELLCVLKENVSNFRDQGAIWALGDFVARAYDPETAFKTFQAWLQCPDQVCRDAGYFGCDVLLMSATLKDSFKLRIQNSLKKIPRDAT